MTGLGWQEIVIVLVILAIFLASLALPIFLILRTLRHHARHDDLRERAQLSGKAEAPIYAGFWDRVGTSILDGLVLLLPAAAIQIAARGLTGEPFSLAASILGTVVWAAYLIVGNGRGATLGKRWAGLRVVDAAGAAPGFRRASVRILIPLGATLLSYFSIAGSAGAGPGAVALAAEQTLPSMASWLIVAVDALWMIWDPRKQTLHDKLAGTFVVVP